MASYIHELPQWPDFQWDESTILPILTRVRFSQGRLIGQMENLGFDLRQDATLTALTEEIVKSSQIEGEVLNNLQVRSSITRQLGIEVPGIVLSDPHVDEVVEMMLDATQNFQTELTEARLWGWHSLLFPTGRAGLRKIEVGTWRKNLKTDPMQVVSGPIGRETVHFQAPDSEHIAEEMAHFIDWFNKESSQDPIIKAAIAHFWFVTIHPFEDGNGRIARAIADLQLARSDHSSQRFYSMSSQILAERNDYYMILEKTQKGSLDISEWILWFLACLGRALAGAQVISSRVLNKDKFWEHNRFLQMNERQKYMINKLLDGFEGKLTTTKWATLTKSSPDTALRDIQHLINNDVLLKVGESKKGTSYVLKKWNEEGLL